MSGEGLWMIKLCIGWRHFKVRDLDSFSLRLVVGYPVWFTILLTERERERYLIILLCSIQSAIEISFKENGKLCLWRKQPVSEYFKKFNNQIFHSICTVVDCYQEVESLTFQRFIWYMWLPSYAECSLISYTKIQIRGGGECFVKLNHWFNPAEKYGVQQYWFKGCNKGYHGLAAQICSGGHKDSGNWKNANKSLVHLT